MSGARFESDGDCDRGTASTDESDNNGPLSPLAKSRASQASDFPDCRVGHQNIVIITKAPQAPTFLTRGENIL